jgi:hypothetical protein
VHHTRAEARRIVSKPLPYLGIPHERRIGSHSRLAMLRPPIPIPISGGRFWNV